MKSKAVLATQKKRVASPFPSVLAKGYLAKLLGNEAVKTFIDRQEPEILEHFELVVNTVSMEEAVQQEEAAA